MLSAVLAGALIVAASLVLGSAVMAIAGLPRHSASVPATGISALLVICGIAVKLPGRAVTAAVAVGVALVACVIVFGRSRAPTGAFRVAAIVVVIGAALVAAIPFATSGRVGILGQGLVNDDMASHLLFTEWISTHAGPTPDLIKDGYPLGPHAIVAAAAKVSGASLIEGFAGLTGAIAVLLGLTAYGALRAVRDWLRVPAAIWMLVIALRERERARSWFASLRLGDRFRSARSALVLGIGIPVVAALPELFRLASFSSFEAFNPSGTGPTVGFGNLRQPLNPLEAFGIWPSGEFRITPANSTTPEIAFYLGGLLAVTAFAWGLGRALSRRESALTSGLLAATLIYLGALALGTPYTQAKCLAIAAPLIMLITLRGLLSADAIDGEEAAVPERGGASWWPPRPLRPLLPLAVPLLTVAFAVGAAFSTLLPLRQAAVGPDYHLQEMLEMRPIVDGDDVLFLGRDNFVSWELIGSEVYAPITNHYDVEEVPALYRATDLNAKFDWDNVPPPVINRFEWVVTTSAAMQSEA